MKFQTVSDKDRKITFDVGRINLYVQRYKPFTPFDFELTRKQPRKSDPMRKYYFAVVLPPFMEELGYEPDEELFFHQQLKITYFQHDPEYDIKQDKRGIWRNVPSVFGKDSDMPVSTKKQFVDWVVRKAAEAGVYIPDPNE